MANIPKRASPWCTIHFFAESRENQVPGRSRFCVQFKTNADALLVKPIFEQVARRIFGGHYLGFDAGFARNGWFTLYLKQKTPITLKQGFINDISRWISER